MFMLEWMLDFTNILMNFCQREPNFMAIQQKRLLYLVAILSLWFNVSFHYQGCNSESEISLKSEIIFRSHQIKSDKLWLSE